MRVCLYTGCLSLIKQSGIGQAILHQKAMLNQVGIPTTNKWLQPWEIIHLNTVFPDSPLVATLAKLRGKKVVYYGHSTMEDFKNSFKGSNFFAPLFKRWIIHCYSKGDLIITPTAYSKTLLKSYGINKPIFNLSNGIDTDFFAPSKENRQRFRAKYRLTPNEKAVISVGHYIERKGLLDFVQLAKQFPQVKFFWFGYTNLNLVPTAIKTAIENAPKNLCFPGYVERDQLRDAYCGCDLFAFMTKEETEGIVVLEALACGIPTIVRDIAVYADWLTDGIQVYKAKSFADFAIKTQGVLNHQLPSLQNQGLQIAKERSIKTTGKRLVAIYQQGKLI